jgi:hypothetical protein
VTDVAEREAEAARALIGVKGDAVILKEPTPNSARIDSLSTKI